ncbi:homoserine O-succinyltransferase [Limibacillus sp. MBR-115]|jgi:homoserine O-succinyltransferase
MFGRKSSGSLMPIKIPNELPARAILESEGVPVIQESDAMRQDIRPLRVALLNLMPEKIRTETQLARVLGSTPLQIEMTLLRTGSYTGRNTPMEHLLTFYQTWEDVKEQKFDALIITGAPVEQMPFEDVVYWNELQQIFDWADTNVFSSFFICWGAQAALYHYHGVPKYDLDGKMFGVFPHAVDQHASPLVAGFDDIFHCPVSRYTEVRRKDVEPIQGLEILADSADSGLCLLEERAKRRVFIFNHLEYDGDTLKREFQRDHAAGLDTALPRNYFQGDDPSQPPRVAWRAHRNLLYGNWINDLYQHAPFDLQKIGKTR